MLLLIILLYNNCKAININKNFNQVCWLTTHNSFASSTYNWVYNQQSLSIEDQLDYGVRALMIDLWWHNNQIYMLHGGIHLSRIQKWSKIDTFEKLLIDIKKWLDNNPNEIVTLIIESYLNTTGGNEIMRLLKKNDMDKMLYNPSRIQLLNNKWNKISDMIANNTRLVIMSRNIYDQVIYDDDVIIENDWSDNEDGDKFFKTNGNIYIFNHFKKASLHPYKKYNSFTHIMQRMINAYKIIHKFPNFLAVDFVQVGDSKKVVEFLNTNPTFTNYYL